MAKYSRTPQSTRASGNKTPGGRLNKYFGLYVGFVKDNSDVQRMGRMRVWIPEFGSNPNDESGWFTVRYMSPFAGTTNRNYVGEGSDKVELFDEAQQSYGMWMVPPDLENQVGIMFANGDTARGFWVGSLYSQYMNQMVPGVPAGSNYEFEDDLPTTEYNKHEIKNVDPSNATRPYQRYYTEGITKQGLARDKIRGLSTSSARRESPSQVYGLLTPGPVDPDIRGHRKGGSQMVFDDLEDNEHIGFKTRSGAQIRIDEKNGIVYVTNRDATGWVEISESGQIQIYGKGSMSVRSEEDINLRADRDVNIEAGRNVNMKASKSYEAPTSVKSSKILVDGEGEGGNVFVEALNEYHTTVKNDIYFTCTDGNLDIDIQNGTKKEHVAGGVDLSYDSTLKVSAQEGIDISAGGYLHTKSGSDTTINASNAVLDSGGTLHVDGNVKGAGVGHFATVITGGISIGSPGPGPSSIDGVAEDSSDVGILANSGSIVGDLSIDGSLSVSGDAKAADFKTASTGLNSHTHNYIAPQHGAGPTATTPGVGGGGSATITPPETGSPSVTPVDTQMPETPSSASTSTKGGKVNVFYDADTSTFEKETQEVETIVSKFMTAEPCRDHENNGGQDL